MEKTAHGEKKGKKPGLDYRKPLLAFCTLLLLYLALEFLLFPRFLPHLPLKHHGSLPKGLEILAQSSKKGLVPKQYIALVGDSYAMGKGDWLMTVNDNRNPPFHSAHLIHEQTGQDVVSFARGGFGSISAMAVEPVSIMAWMKAGKRFSLDPPHTLLVYFYEGNDLDNNLLMAKNLISAGCDPGRIMDPEYFGNILDSAPPLLPTYKEALSMDFWDRLFFGRFIMNVIRDFLPDSLKDLLEPVSGPGIVNKARFPEGIRALPDRLQGPSPELTREETALAVYLFEQSLAAMKRHFPEARVEVVYIPSVLSCYDLASENASITQYRKRKKTVPAREVKERSDLLCALISQACLRQGAGFVDARPYLRTEAAKDFIHGPRDWKHFNRAGYTALSRAALEALETRP